MKNNTFKNISIGFLGLILISFTLFNIYTNTRNNVYNIHASYVVDFNDSKKLAGFADNIFIGEVSENLGLAKQEIEGGNIPNTLFKVNVLYNIKGKLKGNVNIKQEGGYDEDGNLYTIEGNKLLERGGIYLLSTKGDSFTIISHPNGSHSIALLKNMNKNDLKDIMKNNGKINEFRKAYKDEVYYEENDLGEKYKISSEKNAYKNLTKEEKDNFEVFDNGFIE